MDKAIVLSSSEWMSQIAHVLRERIGVAADVANLKPVIAAILDHLFYGQPLKGSGSLDEILAEYGVFSDPRAALIEQLLPSVIGLIQRGFGVLYPSRVYRYTFLGGDNILLRELPHEEEVQTVVDQPDRETYLLDLADGTADYYPDRLRRSMGC